MRVVLKVALMVALMVLQLADLTAHQWADRKALLWDVLTVPLSVVQMVLESVVLTDHHWVDKKVVQMVPLMALLMAHQWGFQTAQRWAVPKVHL